MRDFSSRPDQVRSVHQGGRPAELGQAWELSEPHWMQPPWPRAERLSRSDPLSFASIGKNVALITALLLINRLGTAGNIACYAVLLLMAVRSPLGALKALSISGLVITASEFFVVRGGFVAPLKYILLLVGGLTLLRAAHRPFYMRPLAWLLVFGFVAASLAVMNGYFVEVSLLKIASFTFGAVCLLAAGHLVSDIEREVLAWTFSLSLVVAILSYGALVIGAGYGSFETIWGDRYSGFRGLLSHPQSLGIVACLMAVYLTAIQIFARFPYRKSAFLLLASMMGLLYLSQARTGMLGYFLASGLGLLLVGLARKSPREQKLLRSYQARFFALAALALVALVSVELLTGDVSAKATEFLAKGKPVQGEGLSVLYQARAEQIATSWQNFQQHPWTGINFGTDLNYKWQETATLLSAATEKGFLPAAVLEEVGLIGTLFFVLFVGSLYYYLIRTRRYLALALFTGLLVVNLGEMMFFAFGGLGTISWALIGLTMPAAQAHIRLLGSSTGY